MSRAADRAARRIRALYGDDLLEPASVLHVAAAWQSPDGVLFNMRIGPSTPHSPTDGFALALARARARSIVTTGRILRDEPQFALADDSPGHRDLAAWRRERLGIEEAPLLVVLSRGRALDLAHPAFTRNRAVVMTGVEAAEALSTRARAHPVEVIPRESPGLLDALDVLRARQGTPILVEAGPSTNAVLYDAPGRVEERLLSICHVDVLPDPVRGARLPDAEAVERIGLALVSRVERDEPSGRWTFLRHWRVSSSHGEA